MRDWKALLRERLDLPHMKGHQDERMIEELADHLEDVYREALRGGASADDAEVRALDALGEAERSARELKRHEPSRVRAVAHRWVEGREHGLRRRGGAWTAVADRVRDLRVAVRTLSRRPLFSGVVVLVLAFGIGGTTAIFTLVDAVVLSPLPFDEQDRLVTIFHSAPELGIDDAGQCAAWHLTYEDENRVFQDIGMYSAGSVAVTGVGDPETVQAFYATSGVFRALRVRPVLGRGFTPEDERQGAPAAALVSHGYWQTRFGGDPNVLRRTIQVNGETWEIVGVLPATLRGLGVSPSLILPLRYDRSTLFVGNIGMGSVARLADGVSLELATADLGRMLPLAWEKFPGGNVASSNEPDQYLPGLQLLKDHLVGDAADLLWILLSGVAVVLLIACANVANLFLVRAEGKQSDMAVRTAMGASRRRIVWEYLKESLLLGVLGGAAGLGLAFAGLRVLLTASPAELPRLEEVSLSPTVIAFTLAISLGVGLLFGLLPGLRHGKKGLINSLRLGASGATGGRDRHRAQNALVVSQMALTVILLVGSGLLLRSFQSLRERDPGFGNPEEVLALRLTVPSGEVDDLATAALTHERIARRLGEIPGVTSVGLSSDIPMHDGGNINPFYADGFSPTGDRPPPLRRHKWIGEGYFETLEIPLLVGRTFTWADARNRFPGAIISESLAREYWGSPRAALGQRVSARPEPVRWHEVIGVAPDIREDGIRRDPVALVYWPQVTLAFWEGLPADRVQTWRSMSYSIRSSRTGSPAFFADVREAVWEVNPNLPLRSVQSLSDLMAQSMAETSFSAVLLGLSAGVALILGLVGVYGVISYSVTQRSRELGMRIALGASSSDIVAMVLRQGLTLSAIGIGVGIAAALALSQLIAGLLFGVSPMDPVTWTVVPIGLLLVALLASHMPARRAARVDPMAAIRAE